MEKYLIDLLTIYSVSNSKDQLIGSATNKQLLEFAIQKQEHSRSKNRLMNNTLREAVRYLIDEGFIIRVNGDRIYGINRDAVSNT